MAKLQPAASSLLTEKNRERNLPYCARSSTTGNLDISTTTRPGNVSSTHFDYFFLEKSEKRNTSKSPPPKKKSLYKVTNYHSPCNKRSRNFMSLTDAPPGSGAIKTLAELNLQVFLYCKIFFSFKQKQKDLMPSLQSTTHQQVSRKVSPIGASCSCAGPSSFYEV